MTQQPRDRDSNETSFQGFFLRGDSPEIRGKLFGFRSVLGLYPVDGAGLIIICDCSWGTN
jgi:hypothetical protein